MARRLNGIDGVECLEPTGAFYCFPDVSAHYGRNIKGTRINGSGDFARSFWTRPTLLLCLVGLSAVMRMCV